MVDLVVLGLQLDSVIFSHPNHSVILCWVNHFEIFPLLLVKVLVLQESHSPPPWDMDWHWDSSDSIAGSSQFTFPHSPSSCPSELCLQDLQVLLDLIYIVWNQGCCSRLFNQMFPHQHQGFLSLCPEQKVEILPSVYVIRLIWVAGCQTKTFFSWLQSCKAQSWSVRCCLDHRKCSS